MRGGDRLAALVGGLVVPEVVLRADEDEADGAGVLAGTVVSGRLLGLRRRGAARQGQRHSRGADRRPKGRFGDEHGGFLSCSSTAPRPEFQSRSLGRGGLASGCAGGRSPVELAYVGGAFSKTFFSSAGDEESVRLPSTDRTARVSTNGTASSRNWLIS